MRYKELWVEMDGIGLPIILKCQREGLDCLKCPLTCYQGIQCEIGSHFNDHCCLQFRDELLRFITE